MKGKIEEERRMHKKIKLGVAALMLSIIAVVTISINEISFSNTTASTLLAHAAETPQPKGNIIARGEDGVPWELYENGYLLFKPESGKDTFSSSNSRTWKYEYGSKVKHVGFSSKVYAPEDSSYLFSHSNILSSDGRKEFNPISIDVTNLDTSKVTNMSHMFYKLFNVETLNVTNFDTSKVTDMSYMFSSMVNLSTLNVSHFDTSNVTNMSHMFQDMFELTMLDVTKFDTSKVTDMSYMFSAMSHLKALDVTRFDTSNVKNMNSMFATLSNLTTLDVTHLNTSNVTNMSAMFHGLTKVTELNVTNFDTSKVTDMSEMFWSMVELASLDVTHFNTSKVENMSLLFAQISNLKTLDVTQFDTRNAKTMAFMFSNMQSLEKLDITNFDTRNAETIYDMFEGSDALKEIKLGDKFKAEGIESVLRFHRYHDDDDQYTENWYKSTDEKNVMSVDEWAAAYSRDPIASAGTWLRERMSDAILTFDNETFEPVKVPSTTTLLPQLPNPSQPKQNHKFIGWSRSQDQSIITRESIQPGENVTLYPVWQLVENVTSRTETISVATKYRGDDKLDAGTRREIPGTQGMKRVTTTYAVTPYTGELTNPVETTTILTDMTPTVITLGTKPKVEMINRENSDPIRRVTKYTVNPDTGDITETYSTELPATGTLGTLITIVSATSLLTLTLFLNTLKKTR